MDRQRRQHRLDRDDAIELRVVGAIHHPHAARADHLEDPIRPQPAQLVLPIRRGEEARHRLVPPTAALDARRQFVDRHARTYPCFLAVLACLPSPGDPRSGFAGGDDQRVLALAAGGLLVAVHLRDLHPLAAVYARKSDHGALLLDRCEPPCSPGIVCPIVDKYSRVAATFFSQMPDTTAGAARGPTPPHGPRRPAPIPAVSDRPPPSAGGPTASPRGRRAGSCAVACTGRAGRCATGSRRRRAPAWPRRGE